MKISGKMLSRLRAFRTSILLIEQGSSSIVKAEVFCTILLPSQLLAPRVLIIVVLFGRLEHLARHFSYREIFSHTSVSSAFCWLPWSLLVLLLKKIRLNPSRYPFATLNSSLSTSIPSFGFSIHSCQDLKGQNLCLCEYCLQVTFLKSACYTISCQIISFSLPFCLAFSHMFSLFLSVSKRSMYALTSGLQSSNILALSVVCCNS